MNLLIICIISKITCKHSAQVNICLLPYMTFYDTQLCNLIHHISPDYIFFKESCDDAKNNFILCI